MSLVKKRPKVIHSQARTMIASVMNYFESEKNNKGPLIDVKKVLQRTADACGVSLRTVENIKAEVRAARAVIDASVAPNEDDSGTAMEIAENEQHTPANVVLSTPRKKTPKARNKVTCLDEFDKSAIRRHIMTYYDRKEVPTLSKLMVSLKEAGLYTNGKTSLRIILKELGFRYKKFQKRKILLEKPSVSLMRCSFLRKMHNVDLSKTYFLDETWINQNDSKDKGWTDDTLKTTLATPLGKGKRLIICHAGSSKGWIKAPPLVFESKKTGDYHEDMDGTVFEKWFFGTLIPVLPRGATIVMDNAPYHSRVKDKAPTSSSTKAVMIEWLKKRGIPFPNDLKRPELYELVRLHKPPLPTYEIDDKAGKMGFTIVRLPPYHCQYNPIEMVWSYIKRFVRERNTSFKIKDCQDLFYEAVSAVKQEQWSKYVEHVEKLLEADWKKEGLDQHSVQEFLINLVPGESDEDSEEDSESDDDDIGGVHPL
jgi:transposase